MSNKRILVIDDNKTITTVIERILQKEGYETATAQNGREGLQKVQEWKPDIIILDIVMPEMDGYAVGHKLKENPDTSGIPIIFLSSKGNIDDTEGASVVGLKEIDEAFESGATDFLHKPVSAAELLMAIGNVLSFNQFICT